MTPQLAPAMRTLLEAWNFYVERVLQPAGASVVEFRDRRRSFYAGANALAELIATGAEPTAIGSELTEFMESVQAGRK